MAPKGLSRMPAIYEMASRSGDWLEGSTLRRLQVGVTEEMLGRSQIQLFG
jgi:hypothetical protein